MRAQGGSNIVPEVLSKRESWYSALVVDIAQSGGEHWVNMMMVGSKGYFLARGNSIHPNAEGRSIPWSQTRCSQTFFSTAGHCVQKTETHPSSNCLGFLVLHHLGKLTCFVQALPEIIIRRINSIVLVYVRASHALRSPPAIDCHIFGTVSSILGPKRANSCTNASPAPRLEIFAL